MAATNHAGACKTLLVKEHRARRFPHIARNPPYRTWPAR